MTVLICPVRPGDNNPELQYALRSWEENLVPSDGLQLVTVGYKPDWLTPDEHIEGNRYRSMPLAVFDNVWLASKALKSDAHLSLYMNDDFFCLDPMDSLVVPRRNQLLENQLARFPRDVGLWWPRSLAVTLDYLREAGYPHPDSYEVHRPLPAYPAAMFRTLDQWKNDAGWGNPDNPVIPETVPQWRTLYGVMNGVRAYPVQDCKLGLSTSGTGSPWVSTADESWRRYGPPIKERFRKPSRWES